MDSADNLKMFESEGKKLQMLSHPQIPKLEAYFRDQDLGKHVLVMQHVQGKTLLKIVQEQVSATRVGVTEAQYESNQIIRVRAIVACALCHGSGRVCRLLWM